MYASLDVIYTYRSNVIFANSTTDVYVLISEKHDVSLAKVFLFLFSSFLYSYPHSEQHTCTAQSFSGLTPEIELNVLLMVIIMVSICEKVT